MAFFSFVVLTFFTSVTFLGCHSGKEPDLTQFGKNVKSKLPNETYKKIFATNIESSKQFMKAVESAKKNFFDIIGLPNDATIENAIEGDTTNIGDSKLESSMFFHARTYALSKLLKEKKILTSDNVDDLAQKYVDQLNDAAHDITKDDFVTTLTAQTTAVAKFLKSLGMTSPQDVKKFEIYFVQELNIYKNGGGL